MAFIDDDGNLHFTPAELHSLETEFFQFEAKLTELSDGELRTEILASKWNELMLRERVAFIERKAVKKDWFGKRDD
jgi:hypothetical protein